MTHDALTPALTTTDLLSGRYRLERLLGHGGMSDVYAATDEPGGDQVAVKLVRSTDPELARRLTQEAGAVAHLDHPGLVRLLGSGVDGGRPYLVMELVDGPTLAERLTRGPLPPDRCGSLGTSLAEALAYVHGQGIVHRDVKPGNVLLGPGQRVRLADFGIAQLVDASALTMTGTTLGTVAYMAPEQISHHRVGPAADLWSLGAILLECLTGRRGYHGAPAEVLARRMTGEQPATAHLPTPWRLLLGAMLADDPDSRPDAAEVAEMLRAPAYARPWVAPVAVAGAEGAAALAAGGPAAAASGPAAGPPHTAVAAPTMHGPPPAVPGPPPRRLLVPALVAAAAVALVALVAWGLAGSAPARSAGAASRATTSTTVPPAQAAATALARDVQQEEAAGTLASPVGSAIVSRLGQAMAAAASGNLQGASDALGGIEDTVSTGLASGLTSPADASTLLADVATLAAVMAVPPPTTTAPPTTAPPTTAPPAPAHSDSPGPGGGPKHGH